MVSEAFFVKLAVTECGPSISSDAGLADRQIPAPARERYPLFGVALMDTSVPALYSRRWRAPASPPPFLPPPATA